MKLPKKQVVCISYIIRETLTQFTRKPQPSPKLRWNSWVCNSKTPGVSLTLTVSDDLYPLQFILFLQKPDALLQIYIIPTRERNKTYLYIYSIYILHIKSKPGFNTPGYMLFDMWSFKGNQYRAEIVFTIYDLWTILML